MKLHLLTALTALPFAVADESHNHGIRRPRFGVGVRVEGAGRQVNGTVSTDDLKQFDVRPQNGTLNFKTSVGFQLRPAPTFRTLVYNNTSDNEEAFGYRVNVLRLAEVEGTDNVLNATNAVSLVRGGAGIGGDGLWSFMQSTDRTVNNTTIKTMQARFQANINGANPRATVYLTADFPLGEVTENGRRRKPNALKWSMNITDFPYQSSTSKLAILLSVNSRVARNVTTSGNSVTGVSIGGTNGTFTWNSTIYVDNVAKSLLVTDLGARTDFEQSDDTFKLRAESATYLQFTIDQTGRPNNIFWDPENQVDEDEALGTSTTAAAGVLKVALAGVIAVVAMTLV